MTLEPTSHFSRDTLGLDRNIQQILKEQQPFIHSFVSHLSPKQLGDTRQAPPSWHPQADKGSQHER